MPEEVESELDRAEIEDTLTGVYLVQYWASLLTSASICIAFLFGFATGLLPQTADFVGLFGIIATILVYSMWVGPPP